MNEKKLPLNSLHLKLLAVVSMLIDHMGAIFFPQYRVMRIIGRIAFPIYAYCLTVGCVYTHDMLRYVQRVVLLALIAQPIYVVAMHHTNAAMYAVSFAEQPVRAALNFYIASWNDPSILLSLALGLILLWSIRDRHLVITAAALLGWGGLSVHGQTAAVLADTNLKMGRYFLGKLLQAALSALLAYLLVFCWYSV